MGADSARTSTVGTAISSIITVLAGTVTVLGMAVVALGTRTLGEPAVSVVMPPPVSISTVTTEVGVSALSNVVVSTATVVVSAVSVGSVGCIVGLVYRGTLNESTSYP